MLWINGEFLSEEETKISYLDRGYQFGDGVYEVVRIYDGEAFTLAEHISRFYRSFSEIGITLSYTEEELAHQFLSLLEKNKVENGMLYFQITRGVAERNHLFPEKAVPVLVAYTRPLERPVANMQNGVKVMFTEDIRWLRCDIKSLNLLGAVLAKQKAKEHGCYEVVQHRGDIVTEGSSSNVFIVKDGMLMTHPADNYILNGITRQVILSLAKELHIPVREERFTKQDVLEADEIFVSSTTAEIVPAVQIDDKIVGNGSPGVVTKLLQAGYDARLPEKVRQK